MSQLAFPYPPPMPAPEMSPMFKNSEEIQEEIPSIAPAMRPESLTDYVGQEELKRQLQVALIAAKGRGEAMDHTLFSGPPGLGKTTLAHIIANELEVDLVTTSGPVLEKAGDLASILTQLKPRDVLFIDEIHRIAPHIEEVLYPAMEDYKIDLLIGDSEQSKAISIPVAPFTLVGATTLAGNLSGPLRDRFGLMGRMEYYTIDELAMIIQRNAVLLELNIGLEASRQLALCSRSTPRIANRFLRRLRDFFEVEYTEASEVTPEILRAVLDALGISKEGLDALDRRYLTTLHSDFNSGPVGVVTLSMSLGEAANTLEEAVEPFLIQMGLLKRTPRGRSLTESGIEWVEAHSD